MSKKFKIQDIIEEPSVETQLLNDELSFDMPEI